MARLFPPGTVVPAFSVFGQLCLQLLDDGSLSAGQAVQVLRNCRGRRDSPSGIIGERFRITIVVNRA
ncbi:hypothetical protein WN72_33550 [Bradyrhizobium arachidis]|uniref:Uncharacterized protein n=2 Tax=Bradyrhizobium arachidis TaxID=858423 RepID=A0AAE7NRI0_9BRAD|nr:hypothetical protein WN72_33550 [Bradyrhizobium arachidis]